MRKDTIESAWLHYALLLLLRVGALTVGLLPLGCTLEDPDATVTNEHQRYPGGGVQFDDWNPNATAPVVLKEKVGDQKIKWYVPKGQPYLNIPDLNKPNQIEILRPPNDVRETVVTIDGDYQSHGNTRHIQKLIRVTNFAR